MTHVPSVISSYLSLRLEGGEEDLVPINRRRTRNEISFVILAELGTILQMDSMIRSFKGIFQVVIANRSRESTGITLNEFYDSRYSRNARDSENCYSRAALREELLDGILIYNVYNLKRNR